jgi:hypothetical protein
LGDIAASPFEDLELLLLEDLSDALGLFIDLLDFVDFDLDDLGDL